MRVGHGFGFDLESIPPAAIDHTDDQIDYLYKRKRLTKVAPPRVFYVKNFKRIFSAPELVSIASEAHKDWGSWSGPEIFASSAPQRDQLSPLTGEAIDQAIQAVSYTHLTLPTICSV